MRSKEAERNKVEWLIEAKRPIFESMRILYENNASVTAKMFCRTCRRVSSAVKVANRADLEMFADTLFQHRAHELEITIEDCEI